MSMSSRRFTAVCGIIWGLSFVAARILLEYEGLSGGAKAALAFGPTLPFIGFLFGAILSLRQSDEMEQRIQVETLASAFGLTVLMVATLALAQKAELATLADFSFVHIVPILLLFYLGGITFARRRYSCATE